MNTLAEAAPKKSRRLAPFVVLALTLAFLAAIGVRYKEAHTQKAAFAAAPTNDHEQPSTERVTDVTHGVVTQ